MVVPNIRRPDFKQGLVHLTRERFETKDSQGDDLFTKITIKPFDVLKEILNSGVIRGSGNNGYIKGSKKAVCLSEIPLSSVHYFASSTQEPLDRYRYYGIAISKEAAFKAGGRPVIYLPDDEANWIPDDQKWRHVRYEFGDVDFTHEREWRIPDDLVLTQLPGIYVLVETPSEAKEVFAMEISIKKLIRGVLPMKHLFNML
jgi:hypothetical protein